MSITSQSNLLQQTNDHYSSTVDGRSGSLFNNSTANTTTPSQYTYFTSSPPIMNSGNKDMKQSLNGDNQDMFTNNRKLIVASPVSVLPNLKEFLQETYSSYPSHEVNQTTTHVNQAHVQSIQTNAQPQIQPTHHYRHYPEENVSHIPNNRKYETIYHSSPRTILNHESPNAYSTYCTSSVLHSRNPHSHHCTTSTFQDHNLSSLFDRISQLERKLEKQSIMISDLERENDSLRIQISESEKRLCISNKHYSKACGEQQSPPPNPEPIKTKMTTRSSTNSSRKRKDSPPHEFRDVSSSPVSNVSSSYEKPAKVTKLNKTTSSSFSIVDESDRDHTKSQKPVGDLDEYSVKWKGKTYVLIDAFKNRTQILNYFVPLYQSKFPEKSCKLVLCNEDYKSLFKENCNRSNSEKKHAWRVSIFTIEFYNFVKGQQLDN